MRLPSVLLKRLLATSGATAHVARGPALHMPPVTLHEHMFRKMAPFADRTCLIDKGTNQTYTFEEVIDLSRRTGYGLSQLGMRKGETMVMCKHNSADYVIGLLGALSTGGAVCLVNPANTMYEMRHCFGEFKDNKPKFVLADPEYHSVLKQASVEDNLKFTLITSGEESDGCDVTMTSLSSSPSSVTSQWDGGQGVDPATTPAVIVFSSGTTGLPKGVVLSHHNLVATLCAIEGLVHQGTVAINVFPMYHAGGLGADYLPKIIAGTTQVIHPRFDFEQFLKATEMYKPEEAVVPPPVVVLLAKSSLVDKYDVSSVRKVLTGAAPTKQEVEEECRARLGNPAFIQVYGMSEATCVVTLKRTEDGHRKPASVGTVLPGSEAKVIDPATGEMMGPEEQGEICLRGPQTMMGYLNKPDATAAMVDRDGWIHTGDLGCYDNDGHFYVLDRIKELIKYKGYQVAPAELEAVILEHPDVADVGVIGVPDKMAGELPRAYVVRQPGSKVTEKDIGQHVADKVSHYKKLRGGVVFIEAIPKLASGKILRRNLRDRAKREATT